MIRNLTIITLREMGWQKKVGGEKGGLFFLFNTFNSLGLSNVVCALVVS